MDPFTHVCSAALWTEPLGPLPGSCPGGDSRPVRWRERLALALGALLPDADALLGLLQTAGLTSAPLFERYHRVITHSLPGLVLVWLAAAGLARVWPARAMLPFVRGPLAASAPTGFEPSAAVALPVAPSRATDSWRRLLLAAGVGAAWHMAGDYITAWGRLQLLWPFSTREFQLGRVNSLEPALLALTVTAWAAQQWFLGRGSKRAAWSVAAAWFALAALYVWLRPVFGAPAYV